MYILRIDYTPKGELRDDEAYHRAVVRVGNWNILMRSKALLKDVAKDIHDIAIEGFDHTKKGSDFLISAGPAPEQPR